MTKQGRPDYITKDLWDDPISVVPPLTDEQKSNAKRVVRRNMKQPVEEVDTVLEALGLIPYSETPKSEEKK